MNYLDPEMYSGYQLLHDGILALARAEQQGLRVDMEYLEGKKKHITREIEKLEEQFKKTKFFKHWQHTVKGNVNIHSNVQLANFLYKIKGIKIEKETISGQGATDEEALGQMGIPELTNLVRIRKLKKVRDTYLQGFDREQIDGYIHPFFNLHLVKTYRSSSDHPNFQNIPKRDEEAMNIVRRALFPRPGHQLLELDYSGLEVRIAACYHKDKTMLRYIKDPTTDMHTDMAQQLFMIDNFDKDIPSHYVLRQAAKNSFVFPEFYGDYYKNCAIGMACGWGKLPQGKWGPGQGIDITETETLSDHFRKKGIKSLDDFTDHVQKIEKDFWSNRFADYAKWKELWWKQYKKTGVVKMFTGFQCTGVMSKNDVINYPVQGAAFHCLLWSFIELDRVMTKNKMDSKLVGQIHDSILIDINPNELEDIIKLAYKVTCQDLPKAWSWIIVPLDIEIELAPIDGSWAEKEKYEYKYFFV
jgi:DNA polymerase-1